MKDIKERLRKVLVLVERGEDGEREAAKVLLVKLLKENQLTEAELKESEQIGYEFKYKTIQERRLLGQIFHSTTNRRSSGYYPKERLFCAEMTKEEFIVFNDLSSFYLRQYRLQKKKQESLFYRAFVHKYAIYGEPTGGEQERLSPKEVALTKAMVEAIDKKSNFKKLGGGGV